MLHLLEVQLSMPGLGVHELYAATHRATAAQQGLQLDTWAYPSSLHASLPTLPLWIQTDLCLPLDLEATYQAACVARRIA